MISKITRACCLLLLSQPLVAQDFLELITVMPIDDLKASVEGGPPFLILMLAGRLLEEDQREDAAFYYYLAQTRYRYVASVKADELTLGERTMTSALASGLGQSINPAIGKSTTRWKAVVDKVIDYVETNDYGYCPRSLSEEQYQLALAPLRELSTSIRDHVQEIRDTRTKNGLENELEGP